jgi:hypothetical protein
VKRNALRMIQERTSQHRLPSRAATLERAAALVGGCAELAARLKVSQQQLDYWMVEISTPPHTVFFDAIDIIIENAGTSRADLAHPHGHVRTSLTLLRTDVITSAAESCNEQWWGSNF